MDTSERQLCDRIADEWGGRECWREERDNRRFMFVSNDGMRYLVVLSGIRRNCQAKRSRAAQEGKTDDVHF